MGRFLFFDSFLVRFVGEKQFAKVKFFQRLSVDGLVGFGLQVGWLLEAMGVWCCGFSASFLFCRFLVLMFFVVFVLWFQCVMCL